MRLEATGFGYDKSCLSMRCTSTKPIQYTLLTSSEWNEQNWRGGETLPGRDFLKKKMQSYYIISQY